MSIEEEFTFKQIAEINDTLDSYEKEMIGVAKWTKSEIPEYLMMNIEQLRKKTPDELAEAGFLIAQYCMSVGRLIGRNYAFLRWTKLKIDEVTAQNIQETDSSLSWKQRELVAGYTSNISRKLNAFALKINMRLESIRPILDNCKAMGDSIRDLRFAALQRNKEYDRDTHY